MSYHDLGLFIAFIAVVAALLYRDRRKVKLQGVMFIRRTQKGIDFIHSITDPMPRFWNFLGTLGIIICIPALIIGSLFLAGNAVAITQGVQQEGVRLVLPAPTGEANIQPGFLFLPWWIWLIGILSVVVPHELFHGIMCRTERIRIKSVGWVLLAIIPGAFVEPDEKQLKKARRSVKLKVYAAGSFANLLIAGIMLLVMLFSFNVLFQPSGAAFVANETSVFGKNLSGFILSIDGNEIKNTQEFRRILAQYNPGDTVSIVVAENVRFMPRINTANFVTGVGMVDQSNVTVYQVILQERPDSGGPYLGVLVPQVDGVKRNDASFSLYSLFFWVFVLNFGIGIVNILPIKPLDGGLFFEEIVGRFTKNTKMVVKSVSIFVAALLIFNLLGPVFL